MKELALERFADTPFGVFGRLHAVEFSCFTIERHWLDNRPRVSCIPAGEYPLVPSRFNRGGYDAYEVLDVPDRSLIKIHIGNWYTDVIGCIALGSNLGSGRGMWMVTNSTEAFGEFMRWMAGSRGRLRVSWACGE